MAYQRAYVPMKTVNLTQGYGSTSSSHKISYAVDLSGQGAGKDEVFAPFDCKITKLYQPKDTKKHANTVWLTSTKKVLCANGYYGYLTVSITHPEEISNMKLGTIYKQGDVICREGATGNASGNHIHLEVALGKKAGWSLLTKGSAREYVINNRVKPEEYLFLREDSIVRNLTYKKKKYNFRKESEMTYIVEDVPIEPLNVHNKNNYKRNTIIVGKGLYNGEQVIKFYDTGSMSYIYHYSMLGYVASKYLKKVN